MSYTVFDVETANSDRASICAIGIIRCENDVVVYKKEILINPEVEFDYMNIKIHGITPDKVRNAPTFPEIWVDIKQYFNNTVLIAHNAKSMDLNALYRTIDRYQLEKINNEYICTYELAKQVLSDNSEIKSFRLNVLCEIYDIKLEHHHNALDDASACYELFNKLLEVGKMDAYPQSYFLEGCSKQRENLSSKCRYSNETKAMQKLQMLVMNIVEDEVVSDDEIKTLKAWVEKHEELKGFYPFDKIFDMVEDIMLDGIMTPMEENELLDLLDAFINPKTEDSSMVEIKDKTICLSGDFNFGTKTQVEEFLMNRGATIAKSVTGKIDILILGESGSVAWKYGNYGTKYEKAKQLNEKGKNILIIKETSLDMK